MSLPMELTNTKRTIGVEGLNGLDISQRYAAISSVGGKAKTKTQKLVTHT